VLRHGRVVGALCSARQETAISRWRAMMVGEDIHNIERTASAISGAGLEASLAIC
jgi:ABC-type uncharacterized transport system ATPase subunit